MACPDYDSCNRKACIEQFVCMNGDYWAKYWRDKVSELPNHETNCYYCEVRYGTINKRTNKPLVKTRDHIVPVSRGGVYHNKNIILCCDKCNTFKGNTFLVDFIISIQRMLLGEIQKRYATEYLTIVLKNSIDLYKKIKPFEEDLFRKPPIVHKGVIVPVERPKNEAVIIKIYPKKLRGGTHSDREENWHEK